MPLQPVIHSDTCSKLPKLTGIAFHAVHSAKDLLVKAGFQEIKVGELLANKMGYFD